MLRSALARRTRTCWRSPVASLNSLSCPRSASRRSGVWREQRANILLLFLFLFFDTPLFPRTFLVSVAVNSQWSQRPLALLFRFLNSDDRWSGTADSSKRQKIPYLGERSFLLSESLKFVSRRRTTVVSLRERARAFYV